MYYVYYVTYYIILLYYIILYIYIGIDRVLYINLQWKLDTKGEKVNWAYKGDIKKYVYGVKTSTHHLGTAKILNYFL